MFDIEQNEQFIHVSKGNSNILLSNKVKIWPLCFFVKNTRIILQDVTTREIILILLINSRFLPGAASLR